MQRKTHAERITQKNQQTFVHVQIVESKDFPTEYVLLAGSTRGRLLSKPPNRPLRIGIDLMGNSLSPSVLLDALLSIPKQNGVELAPIGTPDLESKCSSLFYSAPDFITMEESPIRALKQKKNASMLFGLRLLNDGEIDAFISAGSTPALILGAKTILSSLPGIKRPALFSYFPTKKDPVAVLDLGANVQCKAIHFVQFALMASAYLQVNGVKIPKVGLLNIGKEPLKGTSALKEAYQMLKKMDNPSFKFSGNIEGKSVFEGNVDALITDGFTGNVFLKTAEGIANLILERMQSSLDEKTLSLLGPKLADLQKHLHYAEYPGALLLGVNGIVIKSHGHSSTKAFINAIYGAIALVKKDFLKSFSQALRNIEKM